MPDTVDAGPEHDEAVKEWARRIIHTSYVAMGRPELEAFLAERLGELLAALDSGPPDAAADVGRHLVDVHLTNSQALARTLRHLATVLPTLREVDPVRLHEVLSELAAGYAGALREQTLTEQALIQRAVSAARDAAEEALRASEARSRAVVTSSALGIAVVRLDGVIEEVNTALRRIFRRGDDELLGRTIFELADEAWTKELEAANDRLVGGSDDHYQLDTRFTAPDGSHVWTQLSAALVRDARGEPEYQVVLYEDITDRHMLQENFRRQAVHDPLTGLANRTQLQTSLDSALEETQPGRRVGLCYFDLDGFKAVNDSLGHQIGDQLLRTVAQRLQAAAQRAAKGALAARMGGDEFVVLVPDSTGATHLIAVVEEMLREVTSPARIGSHELSASASVGIVERPVAETDAESLLRDADVTLYRAKQDGRAQWVLYDPERNAAALDRFRLSAELPAAIEQYELFVEYRPIVELATGRCISAAASIRWDHPKFGELGEESFLGLAEETGLITRLGTWALEQVCEQAARWVQQLGEAAPVAAVRLSPRHVRDPELVGDVQRILRDTGLPPRYLALGLPESALFDPQGDPEDMLEIFADMGLRLCVYEFGEDYARMSRLKDLPLGMARIEGPHLDSFADPSGPTPLDEHLVVAACGAAKLLGLPVSAAGVRDERQAHRLRDLGVSLALGPFTGGLVSAVELVELVLEQSA
ncbi:putative bifunctional diguanylate cyclase/phosphodiesterase [Saccharopolyspora hordei]|uniref:Diguanylate cyclase (GGDEF)-like protein/PAS domain S-box-containing protein n=1 Tax=Saccharopolyspora hordei TaxID=1838 RepID=A0A853AKL6_9PSEU|nr:EAL domain-containing protein [Saccharopolyspora hordei]NYI83599.1 diguanylate cyclase (GGDEF)-like protein/PAS domain S-box-containing protein [Saccharopolyspora hordei]